MTTHVPTSDWRALYVSAVLGGGGALADVEAAIRRLAGTVREQAEIVPSEDGQAALDVTFHLPGPILKPDYEGVRTGRWNKTDSLLVVQVAVPESVSGDAERISEFLVTSLFEALAVGRDYIERRAPALALDQAQSIAELAASSFKGV